MGAVSRMSRAISGDTGRRWVFMLRMVARPRASGTGGTCRNDHLEADPRGYRSLMGLTGPDLPPRVVAAFIAIVVMGGSNAVGVRLGVAELPPLWAATLRFGLAAALLALLAAARRSRLPHGRELLGAVTTGC